MTAALAKPVTVFLCAHGSFDRRSQIAFEELTGRFRRYCAFRVVSGTLEFAERLLDEQIAAHAQPGHRFVLLPLFLAPGMHVEADLRAALARARRANPQVDFVQAPTLGEHEGMETLLAERAWRRLGGDEDAGVVLLAHGSRRTEANHLLQDMADGVWEKLGGPVVTAAFWKVEPDLRQTLRELSVQGVRRVLVEPYFLFDGSLTERIGVEIQRLAGEFTRLHLELDAVLGGDSRLLPILQELVESALESEVVVA
jgi:sirohydrochlorin cobaltochelatase